ncbi:hypothetical protein [Bythopirellula goksoeyrii]|uniref:Putative lipoprotein n=1 Tax=Bythopirellula goksoeyrii TaxID=1400387 RepID=A0A5B9QGT2_9BACT|nr:hypothetical protein [Bythopirellula goksoeyrii]QEG33473.1 putative lipoprotein [Bythopirellula goksoeyrii]
MQHSGSIQTRPVSVLLWSCLPGATIITQLFTLLICAAVFLGSPSSQAVEWDNITGTPDPWFDDAGNWLGAVAPAATDTAHFDQAATYEVWWNANTAASTPAIKVLDIDQGHITFLQNDSANPSTQYELTINGLGSYSDFSVSGVGTTLTAAGLHLHSIGGAQILGGATLTLDGSHAAGSLLTIDGLGFDVEGTLNVQSGAIINNASIGYIGHYGSNGVATVTGAGSQWNNAIYLAIGQGGASSLLVEDGGLVSSGQGFLGLLNGTGMTTVTGTASQWNVTSTLSVGFDGEGMLNILAGGVVSNEEGRIGDSPTSTGLSTVNGLGSQWNNSGDLTVGKSGNGTLTVEAAGIVSNQFGYIGRNAGSTGLATVTGIGSQWNSSQDLYVGESGGGTLNILAGGVVSNVEGSIGRVSNSTGVATVNGSGSQWNHSGDLSVGYNGDGTLNVEDAGIVSNQFGYIGRGASSTGMVTVTGAGSQWTNGRALFVGESGNGTLNVLSGGMVVNNDVRIGNLANSIGTVTVSGAGSLWDNNGEKFSVGEAGQGTLNIEDGAIVNSNRAYIGSLANSTGAVSVSGSGSRWNMTGSVLSVGYHGTGTLSVEAGGVVSAWDSYVGQEAGSVGAATVSGPFSRWNNTRNLTVGGQGDGMLDITDGGVATGNFGEIGKSGGSTGIVTVSGAGSQYSMFYYTYVGLSGNGTLNILDGGEVTSGNRVSVGSTNVGVVNVDGAGSKLNTSDLFLGTSGTGEMHIANGGVVTSGTSLIGRNGSSTGIATVTGNGSQWNIPSVGELHIGLEGNGTVNIENGGYVRSWLGRIASGFGSKGVVTVTGTGSQWNNPSELYIAEEGQGSLNIENGGVVNGGNTYIGEKGASNGYLTVDGSGSRLDGIRDLYVGAGDGFGTLNVRNGGVATRSDVYVGEDSLASGWVNVTGTGSRLDMKYFVLGEQGTGFLNVEDGGVVNVTGLGKSFIGYFETGVATITGSGSQWNSSQNLTVGGRETSEGQSGTLNILDNGLVTVGGTTRIWSAGTVNLDGGRFEFGQTSLAEYASINAVSGSLAGSVIHTDYSDVSTLSLFQSSNLDITDVSLANSGVLYGDGTLIVGLVNSAGGEVETIAGERMRFTGSNNSNAGQVTLLGGQVHFTSDFTNDAGGLVVGNGSLRADGGTTNDGTMAFSGTANVLGDVTNNAGGVISSSGGTTTFFDDVVNNGTIRTNANSFTVYFGSYSGNGDGGLGTVIMEGDLKPGNSPGLMAFGGDLVFSDAADLEIEIGGLSPGTDFDQLLVSGDADLGGALDVSLINGFALSPGLSFEIVNVDGTLSGMFAGLSQGAFVGNYGSTNLFIDYTAGDGNDVALISALEGDFDFDGDVDGRDFLMWQRGGSPSPLSASDLVAWRANYGDSGLLAAGLSAVPEPSGIVLALICLVLTTRRGYC